MCRLGHGGGQARWCDNALGRCAGGGGGGHGGGQARWCDKCSRAMCGWVGEGCRMRCNYPVRRCWRGEWGGRTRLPDEAAVATVQERGHVTFCVFSETMY